MSNTIKSILENVWVGGKADERAELKSALKDAVFNKALQDISQLIRNEIIGYDEIPAPLHHYENMEPKRIRNKFRTTQRTNLKQLLGE